ncbi:MAG: hypothetical protein IPJ88_11845 [Myxococcales bacterium]|nr:MAG: hypothetical protein IPJ88_11845 [Myxococcales bacterium]
MTDSSAEQSKTPKHDDSKERQTAGQRLAAQKAAKAAKKAAKKGRPVMEEEVLRRASHLGDWVAAHRQKVAFAGILSVLIVVGLTAGLWHASRRSAAAADSLSKAIATVSAPLSSEVSAEQDDSIKVVESFKNAEARSKKAEERFSKVISAYPSTKAAKWARLGKGAIVLKAGKVAEAKALYKEALSGADNTMQLIEAFEGYLYSFESEKNYDEALKEIQSMRTKHQAVLGDIADYHEARLLVATGNKDKAGKTLANLVVRLRDEKSEAPAYLLSEAELFLLEIDASLLPDGKLSASQSAASANPFGSLGGLGGMGGLGGGAGGDGAGGMSPEQIQKLLEQLKNQQAPGEPGE